MNEFERKHGSTIKKRNENKNVIIFLKLLNCQYSALTRKLFLRFFISQSFKRLHISSLPVKQISKKDIYRIQNLTSRIFMSNKKFHLGIHFGSFSISPTTKFRHFFARQADLVLAKLIRFYFCLHRLLKSLIHKLLNNF